MQIILLTGSGAKAHILAFSRRWPLAVGLLLGALLATGMFHAGQFYGRKSVEPDLVAVEAQSRAFQLAQEREVESVRRDVDNHLNALALRLGELQAHVIRLDALGERLTTMAELDPGEFDFSESPARGGPVDEESQASLASPDLQQTMDELLDRLEDRKQKLTLLEEFMLDRSLARRVAPSGRPIKEGWLSSGYGRRTDPFSGKRERHHGVDFAGRSGSDIIAVASGVVTWSGRRSGYGRLVEIDHGNGHVTRYAHNKKNLAKVGDTVEKGQVIAMMGSSGRSTGPHVHFEVLRDGKAVNPMSYIRAAR